MESFRYPFIFKFIILSVLNTFPFLHSKNNDFSVSSEKIINQEKLKISYLCFRKDFLPTHLFNYQKEKEELESNLLFVDDIMKDNNSTLKYYLSFASHEEIWGNDDASVVRAEIELNPHFKKNSDQFLREKTFYEINQRIEQTRKENLKKQKLQQDIRKQEEKKKEIVTEKRTAVESTYKEIKRDTDTEGVGNLANYLLIAGGVCLLFAILKKAMS